MTRKETEKRCLEEMQQTIPDAEALWQRIEAQLPPQEQPVDSKQTPGITVRRYTPIIAVAACLTIVVSLAAVTPNLMRSLRSMTSENDMHTILSPANKGENALQADKADDIQCEANEGYKTEEIQALAYESLPFGRSDAPTMVLDAAMLNRGEGEMEFDEVGILQRTEAFLIADLKVGQQDEETGEMCYTFSVRESHGDTFPEEILIRTRSAYILQAGHTFILPLCKENEEWKLAYENAPQLEMTLDKRIVFHDGWETLYNRSAQSLQYSEYPEYSNRMYLGNFNSWIELLAQWDNGCSE